MSISWQSHELCQLITWHYTMSAYLCHLFFSDFCGEAERSEPACISSWYVRFEDTDESKKERKGGESCWEGGREGEKGGEKKKIKWCNTTDAGLTHLPSLLCEWASLHHHSSPCSHQTGRSARRRTISSSQVGTAKVSYYKPWFGWRDNLSQVLWQSLWFYIVLVGYQLL